MTADELSEKLEWAHRAQATGSGKYEVRGVYEEGLPTWDDVREALDGLCFRRDGGVKCLLAECITFSDEPCIPDG